MVLVRLMPTFRSEGAVNWISEAAAASTEMVLVRVAPPDEVYGTEIWAVPAVDPEVMGMLQPFCVPSVTRDEVVAMVPQVMV